MKPRGRCSVEEKFVPCFITGSRSLFPAGSETQGELQRQDWYTAACQLLHQSSEGTEELLPATRVRTRVYRVVSAGSRLGAA